MTQLSCMCPLSCSQVAADIDQWLFFSRSIVELNPEHHLLSLSEEIFSGSKYPKNISINCEKRSTDVDIQAPHGPLEAAVDDASATG